MFTRAAVLGAFVLVILRGIESLLAARFPRFAISLGRVLDGVLADADDEFMKKNFASGGDTRARLRLQKSLLYFSCRASCRYCPRRAS